MKKKLSELNLLDRSLFNEAMENPENMKTLLDIIFGSVDFNEMNNAFIIIIAPFDVFGKGFYRYTFRMRCEEDREIELGDEVTRIFLNCHGKHPELVSPELIELLKYMETTTGEVASGCKSEKIHQLHQKVCQIRMDEKVEERFMREWEEKEIERQKAFAEGKIEGKLEGKIEGQEIGEARLSQMILLLKESNREEDVLKLATDKEYREKLFKEFNI